MFIVFTIALVEFRQLELWLKYAPLLIVTTSAPLAQNRVLQAGEKMVS
ncbi:MAG: hypothetical protein M3Z92_12885 [Bacteroidota bacterium]|nr:hypothetical protein [Bacteroidota bacterium]